MEIIVDMSIVCHEPGNNHVHALVGKAYKSDLVPMVGMEFEDGAWKSPRKIESVTINPEDGYYLLYVGDHPGKNVAECEQLKKMYHSHGWTRFEPSETTIRTV